MAAVIAGNGLGLFNSSMTQIGVGGGRTGPSGDNQYVNVATGNLLLQAQDEQLQFRGLSVGQLRTYNSLGLATQVGADAWLTGFERKVELLSGTLNAAGSVMRLHTGDGAFQDFTYVSRNTYRSTGGDGAHDTLTLANKSKVWTHLEGSSRRQELYADHASASLRGRLTHIVDLKSDGTTPVTWDVIYDAGQRLIEVRSGDGTTGGDALVFTYDASGRLASLSTRENGVLRGQVGYEYDSAGRLAAVLVDLTPDDGVGDRNTWDAATAANNDGYLFRTNYTYVDATSLRIAQVRHSDGTVVSYTYDASGRIRTVTHGDVNTNDADGAGQTLTFSYDTANRSTDVGDSTGRTWTYIYDAAGQLAQIKAPAIAGQRDVTTYSYDAAGNITRIRTERGSQIQSQADFQYDTNGNVLWQWDMVNPAQNGAARAVSRTYNAANQVITDTVYIGLDADGALAGQAPSGGVTTNFVYDSENRLRFVVTAAGDVKEVGYATTGNGIGQVASTRQYLGAAYSGGYTLALLTSWATASQKADSTLVESFYDLKGRLAQTKAYARVGTSGQGVEDDSAQITEFVYDAQGLLRQQVSLRSSTDTVNDGRDTRQSIAYVYDGMGRLLSEVVTEKVGTATAQTLRSSTWAYLDSANTLRTTLEGGAVGDGITANDLLRTEVRNAAGQRVAVTESAVSGGASRTAQNFYDTAGRLRATQDAGGGRSYFFYDAKGELSAQVDATGALTEYVRDGRDRVVETIAYSERVITSGWLVGNAVVPQTLVEVRPGQSPLADRRASSTYDGAGRRLTQTDPEGTVTTYSYDGANRLLQTRSTDAAGTAATARVTRYFRDALGREVGRLDAEGYLVEVAYDRAGRRVRTTAYANATLVTQRAAGTLAELRPATSANDQVSRAFHDGRGNAVAELNAEGYLTEFVYDEARNQRGVRGYALQLTGLTGSETLATLRASAQVGAVRETRRSFDTQGRLQTELNAEGAVTHYTYDAQGQLVKIETAQGTVEQRDGYRRYDVFGNLVGELGGEGAVQIVAGLAPAQVDAVYAQYGVRHQYDALGRRIESIDAQDNKTWYFYDAASRLTQTVKGVVDAQGVRNAEGEVTETRYTAFGEVRDTIAYTGRIAIAAPFGRDQVAASVQVLQYLATADSRTQFDYDRRGQLRLRLDALGNTTTWNYNAFGEMTRQTMQIDGARSLVTTSDYDLRGLRKVHVGDVGGVAQTQAWTYDAFGHVTAAVDGRGNSTTLGYDRLGRQVSQSQTVSGRIEQSLVAYDAWSRVLTQTDAMGRITRYAYVDATRSMEVATPEGVTLTTARNRHGETSSVTDAKGNATVYTYNKDGQLTQAQAADGGIVTQAYDTRGQLFEAIDATGRKVSYQYDAVGRVLARIENPGGLGLTTRYAYDGQGRQLSVTDPAGMRTTMAYDRKGQLSEVVRDAGGLALKTSYTWDARGLQLTVIEGAGTAAAMTVAYAYDNLGRRTSETVAPGTLNLTTGYTYDGNGNVVARTDEAGRVTRYTYDEANRTVFAVDGAGGVVRQWYDANGRSVATRAYAQAINAAALPTATTTAAVQALLAANDTRDVQQYRIYDNDGRARLTIDGAGAVTNTVYDVAGRQVRAMRYANATTLTAALRTQLQDGTATVAGVLAGVTADPARDQDNFLVLDAIGRIRYMVATDGSVSEMRYDLAGRVTQTWSYATALTLDTTDRTALSAGTLAAATLSSRLSTQAATARVQYSIYDAVGRERYSVLRADSGSAVISERQYDAIGRTVAQIRYGTYLAFDPAQTEAGVAAAVQASLSADAAVRATQVRTTRAVYDTAGRQRFAMDASGAVSESRYDASGRVFESRVYGQRPPISTLTETQLNTWGQAQSVADLRSTFSSYDTAGHLKVRTDGLGKTEQYDYDGAGLVVRYTDRNNAIWNYGYDAAGRRTTETSPEVAVATVDAAGTVTQTSRRLVTRIGYDGQGNVTTRTENADTAEARSTQYLYDNRGHQVQTIFPDAWQVNEATGELEASGQTPTIDITYDTLGRAVVQKDVRGHYSYKSYNVMGQLAHEVDQEGYVTAYYYDAFGQQSGLTRYAAKLDTGTGAFTSSGWVAGQSMSRAQVASGIVPGNDRGITTTYDLRGNKSSVVQTAVGYYKADGNAAAGSPTTQFEYDAYGQLAKESLLLEGTAGQQTARWASTFRYYDALGRNTLTVDAEGYATGTAYNATGEAAETIEYARTLPTQGLTTATRPGTPAMGEAVTGFDRITRWQYDALGRKSVETAVRRYQRADGSAGLRNVDTTFGYDGEGRVTGLTTDAGTTTTGYDALGRATSVQEPARATLTASAENGLLASTGTDLGSAGLYAQVSPYTTVIYDAFGNAVQTHRYANGRVGAAAPVADAAADQIQITRYDRQGRAVMTKDAEGAFVYSAYGQADNVLHRWYRLSGSDVSRDAVVHGRYSYDKVGRQTGATQTRNPVVGGAAVTELTEAVDYNAFGEIASKTYPGQAGALSYTYDAVGRVLTSNEGGATRSYGYNLAGHQVRESHKAYLAAGQIVDAVTSSTIDRLGRTVAVRLPSHNATPTASSAVEQQLDRWGNVVQVIDARGYQTNYQYNDFNQVVRDERPLVEVVAENGVRSWIRPVNQWFYDAFGRLVATKDANGNVRANEYDAAGRLSKSKDAYGNATLYAYDAFGNQRMSQNPLGYLTFKTYDRQNRVTGIGDYLPGANGATRERILLQRYTLNQNGDRLSVTDALNYTALYDYDGRSQLLRSQTSTGVVMDYAYNAQGKKTLERYPRVTDESVPDRWVEEEPGVGYWERGWVDDGTRIDRESETVRVDEQTWDYDIHGRVVDHNNLSGRDHDYSYDAASGMQVAESTAGGAGTAGSKTVAYYANGKLRDVVEADGTAFKYEYDAAGNRTLEETIMRDVSGALTHTVTRTLYDSHNRIARVAQDDLSSGAGKRVFDLLYAYDAVGNRRQVRALSGYGADVQAVPINNTAPTAIQSVPKKTVRTGLTSEFTLLFSDIFRDAEQDTLMLEIAQSSGAALPAWLTVQHDPATGEIRFIAAPGAAQVNTDITVRLTAREAVNIANVASTDFIVSVSDNTPPELISDTVQTIRVKTNQPWTRELAVADYFRDMDVGDQLTLSVVNPATLPWAQIDTSNPSVVRLSGAPTVAGTYSLQVRATDEKGASITKTFQVITAPNSAPQLVAAPGAKEAILGRQFGWTTPLASVFTDPDGDALQVTATGMPAWMSFQHVVEQTTPELKFAGQVPTTETDGRAYTITLKAVDPDGVFSTTTLSVTVRANRAPAVVLPGGWTLPAIRVNDTVDLTVAMGTLFVDPEDDQVFVEAIGLPSWLNVSVDQTARTIRFLGTPTSNTQAGALSFQLRGYDAEGLSNIANVSIDVATDNPPVRNGAVALTDRSLSISRSFSFTLPAGLFADADAGDTLSLGAGVVVQFHEQEPGGNGTTLETYWIRHKSLPTWMSFDPGTRTFSGTVPADVATNTLFIRVSAYDGRNSNVLTSTEFERVGAAGINSDTDFAIDFVPFVNSAPTYAAGSLPNHTLLHGAAVDFSLPAGAFVEPDGDPLTYTAQVQVGSSWVAISQLGLAIDPGTGRLTGTATNLTQTAFNARIVASDPQGLSALGGFVFGVTNTPPTATSIPTQNVGRNAAWSFAATPYFNDVNGNALTYTATGVPAGLTLSTAGTFSGAPASTVALGNYAVTVTANDGRGGTASSSFTLAVVNSAPIAPASLPNQIATAGTAWSYVIPAFSDPNGDPLTYKVAGMPGWMTFVAATRTLSGSPAPVGTWTITVTAADTSDVSTSRDFTVTTPNKAPTVVTPIPTQSVGRNSAWNYTIPGGTFTDANGDSLTYTAGALPAGITFNGSTFSGTPTVQGGNTITVTAHDGRTGTVSTSFVLNVVNNPPSYNGGLPSRAANQGQSVSWTLPSGSFTDPNGDGLSYSVEVLRPGYWTMDNSNPYEPMPVWVEDEWLAGSSVGLSINAGNGTITGGPTMLYGEPSYQIRIVASDGSLTASGAFNVTLNRTPWGSASTIWVVADVSFSKTITGFSDPDAEALTFTATGLPAGVSLSSAGVLSGMVPNVGDTAIQVSARDAGGLTATATVTLRASNGVPQYSAGIPDPLPAAAATAAWNFQVPVDAFTDANGDTLSHSAYLSVWNEGYTDGEGMWNPGHWERRALPSWLTFNATNRTLSSASPQQGSYQILFVASDGTSEGTHQTTLTVGAAPNYAPTPPSLSNQSAARNSYWNYTVPAFSDANGDTLTYSATGMPAGITFTASTRTFSGTPTTLGNSTLTITANDGLGGVTSDSFILSVVNSAPVAPAIANQTATAGTAWAYTIPAFTDPNGDGLTYTVSGLPSWMSYAAGTRQLSGTPGPVGSWTITVVASDGSAATSNSFVVTTPNQAPTLVAGLPPVTLGRNQAWTWQVPIGTFADANGDALSYSASNLPAGISFTASTRTFSGAPTTLGTYPITVTASDGRGGAASTAFTMTVGNSAPVYATALPYRSGQQSQSVSWTLPAGTFTDANGDALGYVLQVERAGYWTMDYSDPYEPMQVWVPPQWLASSYVGLGIHASTGAITGTLGLLDGETSYRARIIATDPSGTAAEGIFDIGVNVAPTAPAIANQTIKSAVAWSFTVPAFSDANGNALTYSAAGIPAGLTFNTSTRVISGTPTTAGIYTVTITANDGNGGVTSNSFTVTVQANTAPTAPAIANQIATTGIAFSYTVPAFSDANGDALSYSATGIPAGLTFNTSTRVISGTPTTVGTYTVTVTANDGRGGVASNAFTISVVDQPPPNRAPVVSSPLPDRWTYGTNYFDWTFAAGAFTDPDNNPLTYTASGHPSWLQFDGANRRFYGAPTGGSLTQYWTITVTAHDPAGLTVSDEFELMKEGTGGGGTQPLSVEQPSAHPSAQGRAYQFEMGRGKPPGDNAVSTSTVGGADDGTTTTATTTSTTSATIPYQLTEHWYSYDAENRLKINNGKLVDGQIVVDASNNESHELLYDAAGRTVARYRRVGTLDYVSRSAYDLRGNKTLEFHEDQVGFANLGIAKTFSYNASGQLRETRSFFAEGSARDRGNDSEGEPRGNLDISGWLSGAEQLEYDRDGRMLSQVSKERPSDDWWSGLIRFDGEPRNDQYGDLSVLVDNSRVDYSLTDGGPSTYDAAGRSTAYRFRGTAIGTAVHTYKTKFEGWESYQEKEVRGQSTDTNYRTTTNTLTYDAMGRLASQREHTNYQTAIDDRMRYYAYNGDGRVQLRRAGTVNASGTFVQAADAFGSKDNALFVHAGGQQQAELKEGGQLRMNNGGMYNSPQLQSLGGSGNYAAGGGKVTVQAGETLSSLAQRIYGSSQRWYVLADANGLSDPEQALVEGTQLNAPNVNVSSNDAGTFKPYNPGEAIGSTSPGLPFITPPPQQQCNAVAMILMIVVAVVVTYFTAGAATNAMLAAYGTTTAAAAGTALGVAAAVAGGFVGGVAGSVASQAAGSAMGVASFSWKQVAVDGITTAITMGAGQYLQGMNAGESAFTKGGEVVKNVRQLNTLGRVTQGVISYGGSMVANIAVGRDTNFSWNAVAANVVGSYVSAKVGGNLPYLKGGTPGGFDFAGQFVNGAVNASARRLFGFGKQDWGQIAVDAFGNALGNAAVRGVQSWQTNRAAQRDAVRSGFPSLFDPDYQPEWLYADAAGTPAMGGVDEASSVSGLITIPAHGDVSRSNAHGMAREQRIARLNAWYDSQPPGGATPIDNTISDEELRGLEGALEGGYDPTAHTLATVEVIGQREVPTSWMNAYGVGGIGGMSYTGRMQGVSDAPRPPPGFDRFGRRIPTWAASGRSATADAGGWGTSDAVGAGLTAVDFSQNVAKNRGLAVAGILTKAGPAQAALEGTQLLAGSLNSAKIDKGDAGHFGMTVAGMGLVAAAPPTWLGVGLYGIVDTALQFNEYTVRYSGDGYKAGEVVNGWESVFMVPQHDNKQQWIESVMQSQNINRNSAETAYKQALKQAEQQRTIIKWRYGR